MWLTSRACRSFVAACVVGLGACGAADPQQRDVADVEPADTAPRDTLVAGADAADAVDADGGGPAGDGDAAASDTAVSADTRPIVEPPPGPCPPATPVLVGHVPNARDLGGTPLGDGARVACGQLFRGAPLKNLTAAGCDELARLGVKTVIDLRIDGEVASNPESACVFEQARVIAAPMPIPYSVSAGDYVTDLHATDAILAAFAAFGDPGAYPIYFHCTYGRDRTGILAALVLDLLGATRAQILAEYRLTELAGFGSYPDSLNAALDDLARMGGAAAYLRSLGVTEAALDVLRARRHALPPSEK